MIVLRFATLAISTTALAAVAACERAAPDQARSTSLAPGLVLRAIRVPSDGDSSRVFTVIADRRACWTPVALKGAPGAWGQRTVAGIAGWYDAMPEGRIDSLFAIANGDFFEPGGVPTGLLVHRGRVIAGVLDEPGQRPGPKRAGWWAFAVDSAGRMHIEQFSMRGLASRGADSLLLSAWNRTDRASVMWLDSSWVGGATGLTPGTTLAAPGGVVVLGDDAPAPRVAAAQSLMRASGLTSVDVVLRPFAPVEAIGGFPVLVRDGVIPDSLAVEGSPFLRERHRRTAIGFDSSGSRFILAVVDSGGVTLSTLASVMKGLGADDALNLDGGPSPDLVVRRAGSFHSIAADGGAEVGSGIGIVRRCGALPARAP
jgi:hypothetical protein